LIPKSYTGGYQVIWTRFLHCKLVSPRVASSSSPSLPHCLPAAPPIHLCSATPPPLLPTSWRCTGCVILRNSHSRSPHCEWRIHSVAAPLFDSVLLDAVSVAGSRSWTPSRVCISWTHSVQKFGRKSPIINPVLSLSSKVGRILHRVDSPSSLLGRLYLMCAKLAGESNWRGRTREYCEDDEAEAEAEAEAPPYRGVIAPSFLCACEDCEVGWKTSECALLVCRARGLSSRRVLKQEGRVISPGLLCACEDCGVSCKSSDGAQGGASLRKPVEQEEECLRSRSMRWKFWRRSREVSSPEMGTLWDAFGPAMHTGPGDPSGCGIQRVVESVFSRDVSGFTSFSSQILNWPRIKARFG
jgi:hypothetical protein